MVEENNRTKCDKQNINRNINFILGYLTNEQKNM